MNNYLTIYFGSGETAANTNNLLILEDSDDEFNWFPHVVKFVFGAKRSDSGIPKMHKLATDTNSQEKYITTVTRILHEFGHREYIGKTSDSHNILFCDSLNQDLEPDVETEFRTAKLQGTHMHTVALQEHGTGNKFKWISNWQYEMQDLKRFILTLLIDLEMVNISREYIDVATTDCKSAEGPIAFEKYSISAVCLRWNISDATKGTDNRIVIKKRSKSNEEWQVLTEEYPGNKSIGVVTGLLCDEQYQFSIVVESYEGASAPLLSDWISIEEYKRRRNTLLRIALLAMMVCVCILDLIEMLLILLLVIVIVLAALCAFLLSSIFVQNIEVVMTYIADKIHDNINVILLVAHIIISICVCVIGFNAADNATGLAIYILPALYLFLWTVIMNLVMCKKFDSRHGVLSIPSKIWKVYTTLNIKLRKYPAHQENV